MNPTHSNTANIPMRPMRRTRRTIALGLAALSMCLLGSVSQADNTTAATAIAVPVNTGVSNFVATLNDTKFFKTDLIANRSYEISMYDRGREWQAASAAGAVAFPGGAQVATDQAFSMGGIVPSLDNQSTKEGSTNVVADFCCFAETLTVFTTTTGSHFIQVPTYYSTGSFYFSIRETTLFSPWLSKGAGFEGFIELHNNTNALVSVFLRGHDSLGNVQGAGLAVFIPANATVFKTGAEIGVPVGVFAGVVLTHNGSFGAISGNITTLNGANGLSFDSPFTPRTEYLRLH